MQPPIRLRLIAEPTAMLTSAFGPGAAPIGIPITAQRRPGEQENGSDSGLATEEAKPALKAPSLYKVIMFNDDYTPMDFVVEVLEGIFSMDREKATRIMLVVHTEGKAVCGVFSRDVAETKAAQVNEYARESHHPLLCEVEREG